MLGAKSQYAAPREIANGDSGTIRVQLPFPMSDLSHIQGK